jgi:hypothetical protein
MDDLIDYTTDNELKQTEWNSLIEAYHGEGLSDEFKPVFNDAFHHHHRLSLLRRDFNVNQDRYKNHIERKLRLSGAPHPNIRIIDKYNQAINNHYNRIRNELANQSYLNEQILYHRRHDINLHRPIAEVMLPLSRSQLIHANRFFHTADNQIAFNGDVDNLIRFNLANTNKLKFVQNREIGRK